MNSAIHIGPELRSSAGRREVAARMSDSRVPERPAEWEERMASELFSSLSPRLPQVAPLAPPAPLAPFEEVQIARRKGEGTLTATWYPAELARGAVLLLHPWVVVGRAYFHRHGRIEALRAAGYHALAVDLGGFGGSSPPEGFPDRDVAAALAGLRARADGLPLHVWGVSAGGYWAHPVLSGARDVLGAVFEDVSPHLLEWSWRVAPEGRANYSLFRRSLPRAYRFLDIRRHAAAMRLAAVAYISGERDRGVRPEDTFRLAGLAQGVCHIIPGAEHLTAIKRARHEIIALALATFRRAESGLAAPEATGVIGWQPRERAGAAARSGEDS
ncbi:MAG TPA: hypothetical protein VOA87_01310 [Thermoanaerobaculia bacterium]|nr:hypothetical protein [Thermoanaerobaculia bacterium]